MLVRIGILDNPKAAAVATAFEYGTAGSQAHPVFRQTARKSAPKWKKRLLAGLKAGATPEQALEEVGATAVADLIATMEQSGAPAFLKGCVGYELTRNN